MLIFGIYLGYVNTSLNNEAECNLTNSACNVSLGEQYLSVRFLQTPVAEEELLLEFDMPPNYHIDKAWIEGINMYMGKTPVMFEDANSKNRGVTFLGSCNLQEMQWRLFVELEHIESSERHRASFDFYTYLN